MIDQNAGFQQTSKGSQPLIEYEKTLRFSGSLIELFFGKKTIIDEQLVAKLIQHTSNSIIIGSSEGHYSDEEASQLIEMCSDFLKQVLPKVSENYEDEILQRSEESCLKVMFEKEVLTGIKAVEKGL